MTPSQVVSAILSANGPIAFDGTTYTIPTASGPVLLLASDLAGAITLFSGLVTEKQQKISNDQQDMEGTQVLLTQATTFQTANPISDPNPLLV